MSPTGAPEAPHQRPVPIPAVTSYAGVGSGLLKAALGWNSTSYLDISEEGGAGPTHKRPVTPDRRRFELKGVSENILSTLSRRKWAPERLTCPRHAAGAGRERCCSSCLHQWESE